MGSSKTTSAVRAMVNDDSELPIYTNIKVKGIPNVTCFDNEDIIKKELITVGKKEKTKYIFNRDHWLALPKPLNIIIDEFHFIADSRESQSQMNKAVTEMISMCRRIIGFDKFGYGDFIMIAQRGGTMDVRVRELVTNVIYHILHWRFICDNCSREENYSSEKPNIKFCPNCGKRTLKRDNLKTERYHFKSMEHLNLWMITGMKKYYKRDFITDIGDYFSYFDTLQYIRAEKKN